MARPSGSVWFVPSSLHLDLTVPRILRHAIGPLPTFTHTLAFSLFTAGIVDSRRLVGAVICAAWCALESGFELGQRPDFSPWLTSRLPAWFDHIWLLANARSYFARGTFDPFDLAAAAAGATVAFCIICSTQPEGIT